MIMDMLIFRRVFSRRVLRSSFIFGTFWLFGTFGTFGTLWAFGAFGDFVIDITDTGLCGLFEGFNCVASFKIDFSTAHHFEPEVSGEYCGKVAALFL
jgi:hypothetical protein